jgi:hypothetical protein
MPNWRDLESHFKGHIFGATCTTWFEQEAQNTVNACVQKTDSRSVMALVTTCRLLTDLMPAGTVVVDLSHSVCLPIAQA